MTGAAETGKGGERIDADSPGLVSDCRLMLSFARKNGFVLPPPLLHEIAWLDSVLRALKFAPVSQMAPQLIWPIDLEAGEPTYAPEDPAADKPAPTPLPAADAPAEPAPAPVSVPVARPAPRMSPEEVILDVHSRLSLLIAPTTALSLQTSEPPAGKRHIFGGMPPLVQYVIVIAFVSAICFVISASRIASKAANAKAAVAAASAAAAAVSSAASAAADMAWPPLRVESAGTSASTAAAPAASAPATRKAPIQASKASAGAGS